MSSFSGWCTFLVVHLITLTFHFVLKLCRIVCTCWIKSNISEFQCDNIYGSIWRIYALRTLNYWVNNRNGSLFACMATSTAHITLVCLFGCKFTAKFCLTRPPFFLTLTTIFREFFYCFIQHPCSKFNIYTKNGMSLEHVNKELRTLRRITKFFITKWLHFV